MNFKNYEKFTISTAQYGNANDFLYVTQVCVLYIQCSDLAAE